MALPRILEPEVMETEKDAVEYDSMDFTEVNLAFAVRALELAPSHGSVLDVGTGTARIPILMLQHTKTDITILATDLSQEMLNVGKRNVEALGLDNRLTLQLVDAKGLPFKEQEFDMVISNSVVHHIPEPLTLFREVARVVKPGGAVFLRDLVRPESAAVREGLIQKYAGDADEYQQKLYRDSLNAALTISEVVELLEKAGLKGAKVVRSSDRHWSVELPYRG